MVPVPIGAAGSKVWPVTATDTATSFALIIFQSQTAEFNHLGNEYVASMDVLEHTSCTLTKHKLFLLIRIDNFPAFVASKAHYYTREFTFSNVLWSVCIYLKKYCRDSRRYINITSGSLDQPECLAACVCGRENIHKKGAFDKFDVSANFKFKQPPTAKEHRLTTKFNSDTTKCLLNLPSLARIDVCFHFILIIGSNPNRFTFTFIRNFWTRKMAI